MGSVTVTNSKAEVIKLERGLRVVKRVSEPTSGVDAALIFYDVEELSLDATGDERWITLKEFDSASNIIPRWARLLLDQVFLLRAALDVRA